MITVYYFTLLLLTLPILTLFIVMANSVRYRKLLFIVIPLTLAVVFKLIYTLDVIKSLPKTSLPNEYTFLHSIEVAEKFIFVWVLEKGKEVPHTVVIPWSQKDAKESQDAKRATSEGRRIEGMNKKTDREGKNRSTDDEKGELRFYQFNLQDLYKK